MDVTEETEETPAFADLLDLASARIGAIALDASDEFFAPKENLLQPGRGIFIPDKYTDHGKWMDGWETRRRRTPGHDWCVIRLGYPGTIRGVDIDTNHFVGNYPERASVDAASGRLDAGPENLEWHEILAPVELGPTRRNLFPVDDDRRWTHLRLNIYPDGGVARFRAYGYAVPQRKLSADDVVDLACVENGGVAVVCSDQCFGSMNNMLMPYRPANMGDGWETRRRRGPGFDWAVVRLGQPGRLDYVEVDTTHFKGNYPGRCSVEACFAEGEMPETLKPDRCTWTEIVPERALEADTIHRFDLDEADRGPFTHVRLNIFPDGGVARFRVFGSPAIQTKDGLH